MKKLKIALFAPYRVVPEGGPKATAIDASYLAEKHEVTVFTQKLHPKIEFKNCKIELIRPHHPFSSSIAFLMKKIKDFDLIVVEPFPANLAGLRNSKTPCIQICHSPVREFYDLKKHLLKNSNLKEKVKIYLKNLFFKKLDLLSAKKVTRILAVSKEVQKRIKKYYHRDSEILYAGIDENKYKTGKYDNYILSVCRLTSAKRPDVIIKSMEFVRNKNMKLIVVGTGPIEKEIEELSKKYENVEFKGYVSNEELANLYANCLALIYVPISEDDVGYAPMEASASGKLTIGANEGGMKEDILDGKTGFLLDKITPEEIAKKIDYLAENKEIAKKMGIAAKKYGEKFYLKNTLKVLDKTIDEIIKTKELLNKLE
jgi:glycosyltransferase involved in cell wall biosynthesis